MWKNAFDAWEKATARYLEVILRSPAVLMPSGVLLTAAMKAKAAGDRVVQSWWGAIGLPTKRDQERTLWALQQIQSRLMDLEERMEWTSPRTSS
jgi:hypothetical protein